MTDRIDTPADLVATLATIAESLNTTAMPTLDNIEAQLIPLLDDAEARNDQQAITLIQGTYARAQELINVAQASRENAATAVDLAQTFRNQRDGIAKELEELTEAVETVDLNHPAVGELAEYIQEDIYEYQSLWDDDAGSEARWEYRGEICHALNTLTGRNADVSDNAAVNFIEMLEGDFRPSAEQVELLKQVLATFATRTEDGDDDE